MVSLASVDRHWRRMRWLLQSNKEAKSPSKESTPLPARKTSSPACDFSSAALAQLESLKAMNFACSIGRGLNIKPQSAVDWASITNLLSWIRLDAVGCPDMYKDAN